MHEIAIGLLTALLAAGVPLDQVADGGGEVEAEYHALLEKDQDTLDDVNRWIEENEAFRQQGGGVKQEVLAARISVRLDEMRKEYEAFLEKHPRHVEGRIAFGSFLNEISDETGAGQQWEKARLLDPSHPAAWNNLANLYGHRGPVALAFPYYEKAIELTPDEPVYYQNLATTVYLFRRDAEQYYGFTEQQVFDHALKLYRKALELSGGDFAVANDLAQTYYGIDPFRYEEALATWLEVQKLARTDVEQENVFIHLARIHIMGGHLDEAEGYLNRVTLPQYAALRERLQKRLDRERSQQSAGEQEQSDSGAPTSE